jgi:soluble lytic murein transglycosylase-like protein
MKNSLKSYSGLIFLIVISILFFSSRTVEKEEKVLIPAERMFESITAYADTFDVPLHIAFNVATIESGYRGPKDSTYKHNVVSKAGAVGPMQIMPKYASWFAGYPVKRQELKDSIELNVWLSMKILNHLYEKHRDWTKALGAYNTGKPIINSYARNGSNPKFYQARWIE